MATLAHSAFVLLLSSATAFQRDVRSSGPLHTEGVSRLIHEHTKSVAWRAFADWDPELLARPCLPDWMNETSTRLAKVCSDHPENNIKDDKGNYIQFTRREDRLMYKVWSGAFEDCTEGKRYVRDIVESFAERTSCFTDETTLADDASMYIPVKELRNGRAVATKDLDKIFCDGDEHTTPNRTVLFEQLALFQRLVAKWDQATKAHQRAPVCREMLAAHAMDAYGWHGVLHSTRPAACNAQADHHDQTLCSGAEKYLFEFLQRDLFVNIPGSGFKGRAAEGENERSEKCKEEILKGKPWYEHLTRNVGSTVEIPKCTIRTDEEVFPEPILKVGIYHENMANNIVADAYRQCGAPFIAGISATLPLYLASAAAGPAKVGQKFKDAVSMKEVLTLMSMLELGGFHAVTGLSLGVNYYHKRLVVTPPFDSGAFDGSDDGFIRCHDTITNCCTNATKVDGFYNHKVYLNMIEQWENIVENLW